MIASRDTLFLACTRIVTVVRPFASAKVAVLTVAGPARPGGEQVIGFYVLEVTDENEAVELAAKIPAAAHGRVETRPILVFS